MIELDPLGKHQNEPGAKLDAGKNRLGLVLFGFARALQEVGRVGTYGANKYTDNGWVEVPDGERRYTDALMRHLLAEASGEETDPDTGIRHAAHSAWNALARLDLAIRREGNDAVSRGICRDCHYCRNVNCLRGRYGLVALEGVRAVFSA